MHAVAAITLFVGGAAVTGPAAAGALGLIFYLAPHYEDEGRHGARAYDAQNYNCGYHFKYLAQNFAKYRYLRHMRGPIGL